MEESVSFGKFESDESLCWEKWSSFSQNKYMAEAEKCSTPGSVAKRRAYFEAHYKKIAAQSAEIFEQEQRMPTNFLNFDDRNHVALSTNGGYCGEFKSFISTESDSCDAQCNDGNGIDANQVTSEMVEVTSDQKESTEMHNSDTVLIIQRSKESEEDVVLVEGLHEAPNGPDLDELVEELKVVDSSKESDCTGDGLVPKSLETDPSIRGEKTTEADNLVEGRFADPKQKNVPSKPTKQKQLKKDKQISLVKKTSKAVTKKDETILKTRNAAALRSNTTRKSMKQEAVVPESGIPVNSGRMTSRTTTKPAVSQDKTSSFKSTRKQVANPASPAAPILRRNPSTKEDLSPVVTKSNSVVEKRRLNAGSRHILVDSVPPTTSPGYSIMEQMGDKDIVKKAFKTFRSSFESPRTTTNGKHLISSQQISRCESEKNSQSAPAVLKDNNRRNNLSNLASQRRQTSTQKSTPASSGKAAQWK